MRTVDAVLRQLTHDEKTRDNDARLCAKIWWTEWKNEGGHNDIIDFFTAFSQGQFTSPESIRRCRQKLQELYPGLRGKSYSARHNVDYTEIFKK